MRRDQSIQMVIFFCVYSVLPSRLAQKSKIGSSIQMLLLVVNLKILFVLALVIKNQSHLICFGSDQEI